MAEKIYTLGLDIGTNSVGWCVVDQFNNIVKKLGHSLWGVRMFDESEAAATRRKNRTARRRLARRRVRINLLQELFAPEINKIDPTFFQRLDDSFYRLEDKKIPCNDLFVNGLTNAEYYDKYPTIWHLRKHLMESKEKEDIRLVYLACHHIIKYRGNFLTEGEFKKSDYTNLLNILNDFESINRDVCEALNEEDGEQGLSDYFLANEDMNFDEAFIRKLENIILLDKVTIDGKEVDNRTKSEKKNHLSTLFKKGKDDNIYTKLLVPLLNTGKVDISKIKPVDAEKKEKHEIDFEKETFLEDLEVASKDFPALGKIIDFIPKIKEIKDFFYLLKLLGEHDSISEAFVARYEEHKNDLKRLKKLIKEYLPEKYNEVFRINDDKIHNYAAYVGSTFYKTKKENFKHCKKDEFYKYIKSILELIEDSSATEEKNYVLSKIEANNYLLRMNSTENGSIPKQLHLSELRIILDNQAEYYDFLNQVSDGYTTKEKIECIFDFKRPYYVGPLKGDETYNWAIKKEEGKIYPWNFNEKVDLHESAKTFITRMQNKCTYLKGPEDYCLPKASLTFSEYNCLSYINKIKINGRPIDAEVKKYVYENIFLEISKPTKSTIKKLLEERFNGIEVGELPDCNCTMNSYIKFKDIFGDSFNDNYQMIEDIIKDITIFEDKHILEDRLVNIYHLGEDKVKVIKGLSYKGYGSLSNNLLNKLKITNRNTGEVYHGILAIMRETTLNLQEILFSNEYDAMDKIDEYNAKYVVDKTEDLTAFLEENVTVSPVFIRPLIQTYKLIEELEDILGEPIKYYSVECTREDRKKEKTKSRLDRINDLYKEAENISKELNVDLKHLKSELDSKGEAVNKADKLYLYFTQLGRDMYTLKPIDLDDLGSYDIDHIYPQSLIKDDSISNRVLVSKQVNNTKSDRFLCEVPGLITEEHRKFYRLLREKDLISKTKCDRLCEREVNLEKLDGFVNRQKVVTDQAVMALITTLKLYKGVDPQDIIYSKAGNISDFRHNNNLVKSRVANNYHHAHDAYLNAVVGKTLNNYFNSLSFIRYKNIKDIKDISQYLYDNYITVNPSKILSKDRYNRKTGEIIWEHDKELAKIKKNMYNNFDVRETFRTFKGNIMFTKVSIGGARDGDLIPIKNTTPNGNPFDTLKYGGIKSPSYTFYVIVEALTKKDVKESFLIPIPKTAENNVDTYVEKVLCDKYHDITVVFDDIRTNVIIEDGKINYMISGVTVDSYLLTNFMDRNFSYDDLITIKKIDKYNKQKLLNYNFEISDDAITILKAPTPEQNDIKLSKKELLDLYISINKMYHKDIYSFNIIIKICKNLPQTLDDLLGGFALEEVDKAIALINELLKLLKTNERTTADLTSIGMSKNSGTLTINKKLHKGMKFYSYSVTGLRRKLLYEVK